MLEDIRYAFRQLRKNPGFAFVALTTLALGIGAAAAMFGLIQGVLLSPPPFTDPDRVVLITPARTDGKPFTGGSTIGQWIAWRQARSFEPPALYRWTFNFLVQKDGSESLGGMAVTKNFFDVLGLKPAAGRFFLDSELGGPKTPLSAVVLGYEFWQHKFGGDPHVLGTAITLSRFQVPLTVVGIMQPSVRFLPDPGSSSEPNYDVNAHVDFWLAYTPDESRPTNGGFNAVTRLRPGATASQ